MTADAVSAEDLQTMVDLERRVGRRTVSETVSDALLRGIGTLGCVLGHLAVFALWCLVNLGLLPITKPFDPFPFGILTLVVSSEGVFLCLLILISQNRMARQADHRSRLTLQIALLAERESTKMLQMLSARTESPGGVSASVDDEARRLSERTDVAALARKLENVEDD